MQTKYLEHEAGTFSEEHCGLIYALEIIQGKWRLPIIWALYCASPLRYGQRHELVSRVEFDETPPHVEYALTESAQKLVPILQALFDWGLEQQRILGGCEDYPQNND